MRDILFRGARKIDGAYKWTEGYLISGEWFTSQEKLYGIMPIDSIFYPRNEITYELIDSETVGQWTGLVDKNGRKIFEGDIIELEIDAIMCRSIYRGIILFDDVSFVMYGKTKYGVSHTIQIGSHCEMKVIGNKFDNPELFRNIFGFVETNTLCDVCEKLTECISNEHVIDITAYTDSKKHYIRHIDFMCKNYITE